MLGVRVFKYFAAIIVIINLSVHLGHEVYTIVHLLKPFHVYGTKL